ncbi:DUF779 domain-containing protein [Cyclobacterium qasimii]|uniref:UDP-glucose 4-epimerase n=2 Tax=Cyclobacterium qasimii TaxID=1350429 RepID=S7VDC9_9BACT|nr:DUF779 domain-containing protein [Cyclobacterium qasimii]EPR68210.1 hypothetical protein ADICYQ_2680 [Cyclobacterium qasimii M12-11B]GEO19789.1 acetaldehyde dehydrogenase [Cyclobacterium qasimii]
MQKYIARVLVSEEAKVIIDKIKDTHKNDLMFHQSGGCCDGSSPMCFEKGDFIVGGSDIWMGEVYGCDFFMNEDQFDYWKHTQLTLDVVPGRGSSFSIEIPMGIRFMIRSRLFTTEELDKLIPVITGEEYLAR